jgi:hypothetical protein
MVFPSFWVEHAFRSRVAQRNWKKQGLNGKPEGKKEVRPAHNAMRTATVF